MTDDQQRPGARNGGGNDAPWQPSKEAAERFPGDITIPRALLAEAYRGLKRHYEMPDVRTEIDRLMAARSEIEASVSIDRELMRRARNMCLRCISPELKDATQIVKEIDAAMAAAPQTDQSTKEKQ